jgi:long-chain acyl-CoA synthetase
VLACCGSGEHIEAAIERANARLAEFQRISRWVLWPEPDLPRTSTGKVRRKPVAAWLARIQAAASTVSNGMAHTAAEGAFAPSSDWLLALIAQITGENQIGVGDELRLTEDLHLDSLGRVQLSAAIEERLGIVSGSGLLEEVQTLGELRRLVAGGAAGTAVADGVPLAETSQQPAVEAQSGARQGAKAGPQTGAQTGTVPGATTVSGGLQEPPRPSFLYPVWPWWKPVQWIRVAFIEAIMRPLAWLLAAPRVIGPRQPLPQEPLLIVANHVTDFDGPLVEYALAGPVRRHIAAAMAGEMLEDLSRRSSTSFHCRASATSRPALPMPAKLWTTATTCSFFPRGGNRSRGSWRASGPASGFWRSNAVCPWCRLGFAAWAN